MFTVHLEQTGSIILQRKNSAAIWYETKHKNRNTPLEDGQFYTDFIRRYFCVVI